MMEAIRQVFEKRTRLQLEHLPGEIRNQIYRYALVENRPILIHKPYIQESTALLKTSAKIRREALPIFLSENSFFGAINGEDVHIFTSWLQAIGTAQVEQMSDNLMLHLKWKESRRKEWKWAEEYWNKYGEGRISSASPSDRQQAFADRAHYREIVTEQWMDVQESWVVAVKALVAHNYLQGRKLPGPVWPQPEPPPGLTKRTRYVLHVELVTRFNHLQDGDVAKAERILSVNEYAHRCDEFDARMRSDEVREILEAETKRWTL